MRSGVQSLLQVQTPPLTCVISIQVHRLDVRGWNLCEMVLGVGDGKRGKVWSDRKTQTVSTHGSSHPEFNQCETDQRSP